MAEHSVGAGGPNCVGAREPQRCPLGSATRTNSAGLQLTCHRRAGNHGATETGICGHRKAIGYCGTHRLP
jgi:hypothetical protein